MIEECIGVDQPMAFKQRDIIELERSLQRIEISKHADQNQQSHTTQYVFQS